MDSSFLETIGYLACAYMVFRLSLWLLKCLRLSFVVAPTDLTKLKGSWALVTGSTDGIGKAYAFAMAKRGLNIVLVSRSPFKLQNVAAEIEAKYKKIKVQIVDIDFTTDDSKYLPKLEAAIKDLQISVLVNNVGMSYDYPEEFLKIEGGDKKVKDLVSVNITALNNMTWLVLPQMVTRGKGVVINIGSMAASTPSPLLSVYSGTKAYVDKFTSNLELEYSQYGIEVQCVIPGYVVSNMSKLRQSSLIAPTPSAFVASALSRLGKTSRTTGYWSHDVMVAASDTFPYWLTSAVAYGQLNNIRKRALRKKLKTN